MSDISLETVAGKLNRVGYEAFMQGHRHAKSEGNRNVELAHWMLQVLGNARSDISETITGLGLSHARILSDVTEFVDQFEKNKTEMPGISEQMTDMLDRGWHYATLLFAEVQIRSGHALIACLKSKTLSRSLRQMSKEFNALDPDEIASQAATLWSGSDEEKLRPMDGSGLSGANGPSEGEEQARGTTALARFATNMTEVAASGSMDPIVGRDEEIRQIIDVLMRRRQNNPVLTGEAGVGKTAVVEGFAQRLASGDVPPQLQGVRLYALDIGLLQAGASMKGEFEQRLRSVIDEVQSSPHPIILFIDEAHTLIGAGGAQGTGDAANLLKPALARGTLRTIGATTWSEYRQYFEKDPALTRRFQPVEIEEPSIEKCCFMLRGILKPMEKHHGVRISDEAIVSAVSLSARYIPARQLPDKAVSLLDTASARVAISQSTSPRAVEDHKIAIDSAKRELEALANDRELGDLNDDRVAELHAEIEQKSAALKKHEEAFKAEMGLIEEILALRASLRPSEEADARPDDDMEGVEEEKEETDKTEDSDQSKQNDKADIYRKLEAKMAELAEISAEDRMIYAHVDEQAVGSVVSDWTGIPVGRMMADEVQNVLRLPEILKERVVGQDHGLEMIARRIETNRAKLSNPNKPIGVFMLCGPSGVGKTETALALAEGLYGGEQNIITINMSEFQEAHSVSLLKGAPPGYVGYGEGGRLTEAVRRKPYSVVLLDEVEKAHPDVHELFFQVFDKGIMEDGSGRMIDFKNTLIILTSNVGTDTIMDMAAEGQQKPDPDALDAALKPSLLSVFPPALLGRIVTIAYFPLSKEMLSGIIKLQLDRIGERVVKNHGATFHYTDAVVTHIAERCNDPASGGRMIDNIITNSLLPKLSREILNRGLMGEDLNKMEIDTEEEDFVFKVN